MSRVKKDIMKCNFPTKVKFMGMTEKKVTFLTQNFRIPLNNGAHSFYLCPLMAENLSSIRKPAPVTVVNQQGQQQVINAQMSDWDKFCILGIYIKFQPSRNQFTGGANDDTICPIQCTYTMNNTSPDAAPFYDKANIPNKQVFTFNSNEAFTIYVPAPPTMEVGSTVVQKSKTWWSLTDLAKFQTDFTSVNMLDEDDDDDEDNLGNPFNPTNQMHAGRICLNTTGAALYNITVNYKVALKG